MRSFPVLLSLLFGLLMIGCSSQSEAVIAPTPRAIQTAPPAATPAPAEQPASGQPAEEQPAVDGPTADREPVAGRADIDVAAFKQRVDGESDVVLIDVRTKREYDGGHVAGAKLIPTAELTARVGELTQYKGKEIHVICAVGGRSHKAVDYLVKQQGFAHVVNVKGGTKAWIRAGYPVVR